MTHMVGKRGKFKPVDPKQDFVAMEKRLLENWYKEGIVKKTKTLRKNSPFLTVRLLPTTPWAFTTPGAELTRISGSAFTICKAQNSVFKMALTNRAFGSKSKSKKSLVLKIKRISKNLASTNLLIFAKSASKNIQKSRLNKASVLAILWTGTTPTTPHPMKITMLSGIS